MNFNFIRPLYLVSLAHLVLELTSNFLPVVYPILISTLDLTYAQVGIIALVLGTGTSLTQPFFGYLSDRWDPARLVVVSILWLGLLMGLVGFTWNYISLLLLVGIASLGSGAFHPAGVIVASAYSGKRPGTALSIFSVGGNLGSAFSPLLIALAMRWWGLSGIGILIPLTLLFSLLLYQQFVKGEQAEEVQNLIKAQSSRKIQPYATQNGSITALILIVIAVMSRSWFQVSLSTYLPEWLQSQGWSLTGSGQIFSVFLISISIGSLIGGALADRIGNWPVLALSSLLLGPAHWLFLVTPDFLQVGLLSLMGIFIGISFPVSVVMAQELWPRGVGLASSLVMGLGWLPGGIGASVTGFIADRASLSTGLQSLIIMPIIGIICILIYAVFYRRGSYSEVLSDVR
jgi:MFS transporter, FSR family, fosmidomycin resistance protein